MDRLFGGAPEWVAESGAWMLPADVRETPDAVEYSIEIPGMRTEDIDLTIENDVLTISGEKKEQRDESRDGSYHITERHFGRFERSFRVPANVDADAVAARYENGVLTVHLPTTEESRPRRIPVESGDGARQVRSGDGA
jgi:HSP20 family protein